MKLLISVDKEYCVVAITNCLQLSEEIKSKASFVRAIKGYLTINGEQCIDDHESEGYKFREQAEEIVDKYYK